MGSEGPATCSSCGRDLADDARFCPGCGAEVPQPVTACPVCGADLGADDEFCRRCGHDLAEAPPLTWDTRDPRWTFAAVAVVWAAALISSVGTADLVSGAEQESIPIAVPVTLFWAAVTSVLVVAVCRAGMSAGLAGAVAAVWVSVTVMSIAAPELVSGTDPTTLPIGMLTAWFWGTVATVVLVAMGRRRSGAWLAGTTAAVWLVTTLVAVLTPELETGTDPTIVPLAAIIAPFVAAALTPLVCLVVPARRAGGSG